MGSQQLRLDEKFSEEELLMQHCTIDGRLKKVTYRSEQVRFNPQRSLLRQFSKDELIALCHSRIPRMRHITDFMEGMPIWSPVPEKYRKGGNDGWSVWGLEDQDPKYLLEELKPFVCLLRRNGKIVGLGLLEGAKKEGLRP